jgi:hypothetical protein
MMMVMMVEKQDYNEMMIMTENNKKWREGRCFMTEIRNTSEISPPPPSRAWL